MQHSQATERRRRRTEVITQALTYQLAACCEDSGVRAMVIADAEGLPLASSGDRVECDELAARMALVAARTPGFSGTLLGHGRSWDVDMAKLDIHGSALLVCAVGGSAEQRQRQIARGAQGTLRILRG
jgi:predicted regulator of Ras-like GTPase activity (Roadblock/LC7/MglB family)